MQNIDPQNETIQTFTEVVPPSNTANPQKKVILFLGVIVLIALASVCGYLAGMQRPTQELSQQIVPSSPSPKTELTELSTTTSDEWKTAKYGGVFSYEYPAGWHVAELWPEGNYNEQGISIVIDPSPISTAPRGGSLGTFQINVLDGLQDPDQVFLQKKAEFNSERYTDIQTETLESDLGPIYYVKGKVVDGMFGGEIVERYFFTFDRNQNDLANQRVVTASLEYNKDPKLSEMLRHIVLSFKKP